MVSFGEAIKTCLKTKIFNWHDRAPRSEFWWFILFATIAQYVLALFMLIPFIGVVIYVVAYVYILWAQFMVSIRRLHDKNRSGWWLILNIVLMVIGSVFLSAVIFLDGLQGGYHDGDTISTILMGIGIIFFLAAFVIGIFIFVMMVTAGTVGPNRFGPDPLALARQEEAMRQQFYQQQAMYGQGMGSNNHRGHKANKHLGVSNHLKVKSLGASSHLKDKSLGGNSHHKGSKLHGVNNHLRGKSLGGNSHHKGSKLHGVNNHLRGKSLGASSLRRGKPLGVSNLLKANRVITAHKTSNGLRLHNPNQSLQSNGPSKLEIRLLALIMVLVRKMMPNFHHLNKTESSKIHHAIS